MGALREPCGESRGKGAAGHTPNGGPASQVMVGLRCVTFLAPKDLAPVLPALHSLLIHSFIF